MAINPLYLGYSPADEENKRRFPGKGFKGGKKADPVEFNFDFQNQLLKQVEYETDIPRLFMENIIGGEVDEIKKALKATSTIGDKEGLTSQNLDDMEAMGEEAALPGATGLSIDLITLATDPKKAIQDMLEQGWKNISSWEEADARFKDRVIRAIVTGDAPPSLRNPKTGKLEPELFGQLATDTYVSRTINMSGVKLKMAPGQNNPLQMSGENYKRGDNYYVYDDRQVVQQLPDMTGWDAKKVAAYKRTHVALGDRKSAAELYKRVGTNAADFARVSRAGSARDKAYEEYLTSVGDAFVAELASKQLVTEENLEAMGLTKDTLESDRFIVIDKARIQAMQSRMAAAGFDAMEPQEFLDVMEQARKSFISKKELADSMDGVAEAFRGKTGFLKNLEKVAADGKVSAESFERSVERLAYSIRNSERALEEVRSNITQQARVSFDKAVKPYEELLQQLKNTAFNAQGGTVDLSQGILVASPQIRGLLNQLQQNITNPGDRLQAAALLSEFNFTLTGGLNPLKKGLAGGNVFNQGLIRKFKMDLIQEGLAGNMSLKDLQNLDQMGILTELFELEDAKALKVLTKRLQNMREWDAFIEALKNFEGGKLWKTYYYTQRVRDNLKVFTPAYWVRKAMVKLQYFGLVIDEAELAKSPALVRYIILNSPAKWAFEHRFSVNVKFVENGGAVSKVNFTGGTHFSGLVELHGMYLAGKITEDEIKELLMLMRNGFKPEDWERWRKRFEQIMPHWKPEELDAFLNKLKALETWMQTKGKKILGKFADKAENLFKVFLALGAHNKNPGTGSITQSVLGILDKVAVKFNELQAFLYKKFGKWLAPISYLKQAIGEIVADAVLAITTALTGGVGALAAPLKFAVQWVVVKVMDLGQAIVEGIFKGDLSGIFKGFEKSVNMMMKYVLYCSIVPIGCGMITLLLMGVIITSINPINMARSAVAGAAGALGGAVARVGELISCSEDPRPLSTFGLPNNTASNSIARRAYTLVNDLNQGFWCYYNRHPSFPNLFNAPLYGIAPYTPPQLLDGDDLFWCTWLVIKAYDAALPYQPLLLGANNMKNYFSTTAGYVYIPNSGDMRGQVRAGDVAFFNTTFSLAWIGHVEIVYEVTDDYVMTIGSNSGLKKHAFTISDTGNVQSASGLKVAGFGRRQ